MSEFKIYLFCSAGTFYLNIFSYSMFNERKRKFGSMRGITVAVISPNPSIP